MVARVFLTGGEGFVGRHLAAGLLAHEVTTSVRGEEEYFTGFDVVIHLAAKSSDSIDRKHVDEYYSVNTQLTKRVYSAFLKSDAKVFIFFSSVRAIADSYEGVLTESSTPNPLSHYGKSKLLAEQYILTNPPQAGKRVYILRPTLIHGPGNKGNLFALYKFLARGFPWPFGSFHSERSFCSIGNLTFVINELVLREDVPSGIYNVCDDNPLSMKDLVQLINSSLQRDPKILYLNPWAIKFLMRIAHFLRLPFNSVKLTHSFVVSNVKLIKALGKSLPVSASAGLVCTFDSFKKSI
jgi:nucleoside-diphosphate-sugar epimerase